MSYKNFNQINFKKLNKKVKKKKKYLKRKKFQWILSWIRWMNDVLNVLKSLLRFYYKYL